MDRQQKEGSMVKCGGNAIWGGGVCENPVKLSMYDGPMENVK